MQKPTLANKVFTENPLLDEIVYNARQLATGVVVKDYDKANKYETAESMYNGDILIAINRGTIRFENFKYDYDFLFSFYNVESPIVKDYAADNNKIPMEDRDKILEKAVKCFTENYEERNTYYRMLKGLPPCYDEEKKGYYGLWINVKYIDNKIPTDISYIKAYPGYQLNKDGSIKFDDIYHEPIPADPNYKLIHRLDSGDKNLIYENGTCDNIVHASSFIAENSLVLDDVYYVMHLGDREVDYYDARVTEKFGLLYCPKCDSEEVKSRFKDLFEANRMYTLYTIYSEAYKYRSDYYDNFIMIFLVIQTIIDMIVELPEYIIRRDVFDARTCKYIFESNGVKYFSDIPLKYQISLVKNLNKLIKFKSTDKCIVDIVSIFGIDNIEVFRYYIMKDRFVGDKESLDYYDNTKTVTDSEGNVSIVEDNDRNYDLKFIKVPILGKYDDYIRAQKNIYGYDTLIENDGYWTGDKDKDTVKKDVKDLDFTVLKSKYYSIEAVIDLAKKNFTMTYFMNMLINNSIDSSRLKVNLPNVSTSKKFELIDTICALFSLSYIYYGVDDTILDSRSKAAKILGFNLEADLAKISTWLEENHKGLTLKDLHVDTFTVPESGRIMSFSELEDLFFTNKDCYDHIRTVMANPPSKEIYNAYRYINDALMTTNRNMEYFLVGDNTVYQDYKSRGYKVKFIEIPQRTEYFCPHCGALVDFENLINGYVTDCPVCKKNIGTPINKTYTNENDYHRDLSWLIESMDYETLYFVVPKDFDQTHDFDLYVKESEEKISKVGTAHMAYTYREFLKSKDGSLYNFITDILAISNIETRQETCINAIQAIVSYLKDYIDQDGDDAIPLDTVFSGLPSISFDFIKNYVEEVIDFFKSFKIFTSGSSIMYTIEDRFDNYVQLIDHILLKYLFDKSEVIIIEDAIRGKIRKIADKLYYGPKGIGVNLSSKETIGMIDKVWLSITNYIKYEYQYSDFYNFGNYAESDPRIRDICGYFATILKEDNIFDDHSSEEGERSIDDIAVDIIVRYLASFYMEDKVIIDDNTSLHCHTNESLKEFYNNQMSDVARFVAETEKSDKVECRETYSFVITHDTEE